MKYAFPETEYRHKMYEDISKLNRENGMKMSDNEMTKRFANIYLEAGAPEIRKDAPFYYSLHFDDGSSRPVNSPTMNTIYNIQNVNNAIEELAHPIQKKYGKINGWGQIGIDVLGNMKDQLICSDYSAYDNPNNFEAETHNQIEPILLDYFKGNIYDLSKKLNEYKHKVRTNNK